jgi:hypothetical protein
MTLSQTLENLLAKLTEAEANGADPALCAKVRKLACAIALEASVPSWQLDCARVAREAGMDQVARTPSPIGMRSGFVTWDQSDANRRRGQ